MQYAHQNPNAIAAAADGDEHGARPVDALALDVLDALQRQDGTRDDLTDRDDRQLAVPFDDVMRVPWRPGAAFGDGGLGEFDGRHERGDREDDDTDHLHHRQQPVQPVVGVVGTREPRVVDPRPDDAEARETRRSDARRDVPVRERVRELRRARGDGDGERQVEEQLERAPTRPPSCGRARSWGADANADCRDRHEWARLHSCAPCDGSATPPRALPTSAPGASAAQAAIATSEPSTTSYMRAPTSDGA
ncbi:hypothetical protein HX89_13510 [Dermacoccus nishinomiyaensis]|uniref:Uncharacterized protein n=1 Tax=Dermacoccus nishinomiyaensis TaxID=1274 RepID=A0A075JIH1_9MICO|nr:hypothetical protein HX89_13510 [Dermacoccus nishinomiyaensis]